MRYTDFIGGLDASKFPYEVDDETWSFWKEMRTKYNNRNHADVMNEILCQKGYPWIGKLVLAHKGSALFGKFKNTSEKIIHYADKRCKHENIVSITERVEDLAVRYGQKDPESRYWKECLAKSLELEKELGGGDIIDEQIRKQLKTLV